MQFGAVAIALASICCADAFFFRPPPITSVFLSKKPLLFFPQKMKGEAPKIRLILRRFLRPSPLLNASLLLLYGKNCKLTCGTFFFTLKKKSLFFRHVLIPPLCGEATLKKSGGEGLKFKVSPFPPSTLAKLIPPLPFTRRPSVAAFI